MCAHRNLENCQELSNERKRKHKDLKLITHHVSDFSVFSSIPFQRDRLFPKGTTMDGCSVRVIFGFTSRSRQSVSVDLPFLLFPFIYHIFAFELTGSVLECQNRLQQTSLGKRGQNQPLQPPSHSPRDHTRRPRFPRRR